MEFSWRLKEANAQLTTPEELLALNDHRADIAVCIGSMLLAVLLLFAELADVLGIMDATEAFGFHIFLHLFLVLLIPVVVYICVKGAWRGYRYFALTFMVVAIAGMNVVFQSYWLVVLCLPLFLSAVFYSKKLTLYTGILTLVAIVVAYCSIYLLQHNPLYVSYELDFLGVVPFESMEEVIYSTIVPFLMHLTTMVVIAYIVAACGRYLVFRQAEISVRAAQTASDLEMAAALQREIMPHDFDAVAQEGVELFAVVRPAKETAGDFYDCFITVDEEGGRTLNAVVADVSDKGLPAAMFMMLARNTIRTILCTDVPLARAVATANSILCDGNDESMFVTALIMRIDLATRHVEFVSAGHGWPLVRDAAGNVFQAGDRDVDPDIFLGVLEGADYCVHSFDLQPGDTLVAYTDGATDAEDPYGAFFGEQRLFDAIAEAPAQPAALCASVLSAIDACVRGRSQYDDITLLALRFPDGD